MTICGTAVMSPDDDGDDGGNVPGGGVPDGGPVPGGGVPDDADGLAGLALIAAEESRLTGRRYTAVSGFLARVDAEFLAGYTAGHRPGSVPPRALRELARSSAITEIACMLRIPEGSAHRLAGDAERLTEHFPGTLAALADGRIPGHAAQVIVSEAEGLPDDSWADFEQRLLVPAVSCTRPQLMQRAIRLREKMHPDSIAARRAVAVRDRHCEFIPDRDGMAWFRAYLPAELAKAVYDQVTAAAIGRQGPGESRSLTQLRSDSFADLMLTAGTGAPAPDAGRTALVPTVILTIPVLGLIGATDDPAQLEGYGPIPMGVAKELAARAPSFLRVLTDPHTGALLDLGRDRYKPSQAMRDFLQVRDQHCRFPGCGRSPAHCDIDHTLAWGEGGDTSVANAAYLCPKHHLFKHKGGWTVRQPRPGVLEWTSPHGRIYLSDPDPPVDPAEFPGTGSLPTPDGVPNPDGPPRTVDPPLF